MRRSLGWIALALVVCANAACNWKGTTNTPAPTQHKGNTLNSCAATYAAPTQYKGITFHSCPATYSITVYRKTDLPPNTEWVQIGQVGTLFSAQSDCPEEEGDSIYVDLLDGTNVVLLVKYGGSLLTP